MKPFNPLFPSQRAAWIVSFLLKLKLLFINGKDKNRIQQVNIKLVLVLN